MRWNCSTAETFDNIIPFRFYWSQWASRIVLKFQVREYNFQEEVTLVKDITFKVNDRELIAQLSQANTKESLASENERRASFYCKKKPSVKKNMMSLGLNMLYEQASWLQQIAKTQLEPSQEELGSISVEPINPAILVANLVNIES
jgi:membrane fusion protein (multidrug efflux system)